MTPGRLFAVISMSIMGANRRANPGACLLGPAANHLDRRISSSSWSPTTSPVVRSAAMPCVSTCASGASMALRVWSLLVRPSAVGLFVKLQIHRCIRLPGKGKIRPMYIAIQLPAVKRSRQSNARVNRSH
jgi:hypothetical protein